ncbi:hypothetical protein FPCIR_3122 [Fusarium pseudocircinatum]|uniref:NmrA-like domain-containing protein n=1 Tax=Fusarium pseudocircinatum TaxID=56676 RepID=A0A8H5PKY4_9HYPO|nr:hypothetical protein FPCIR_3122 [Fusarium pseudocircinatum]
MSSTKLIAVLGATGNQGGSVVDVFLKQPGWKVRAITRNSSSPKSRSLVEHGVEVVEADLGIPETLKTAFEGANAIFVVSNYMQILMHLMAQDKVPQGQSLEASASAHETQYLCNAIDTAATSPTLERFVLSSLPNISKWSGGKYTHVLHWDSKARAADYVAHRHPALWNKTCIIEAGFFLQNFIEYPFFKPVKQNDGSVHFITMLSPNLKLPFIAPEEDTGPLVRALLEGKPGKQLIGYRELISLQEFVASFASVTGYESKLVTVPQEEFLAKVLPSLQVPLCESLAFMEEFGYTGGDTSIIHPAQLSGSISLPTVADYVAKQPWNEVLASE